MMEVSRGIADFDGQDVYATCGKFARHKSGQGLGWNVFSLYCFRNIRKWAWVQATIRQLLPFLQLCACNAPVNAG